MSMNCGTEYKTNGLIEYETIREMVADIKKGFGNGGYQAWVNFKNEIMPRMIINTDKNCKINISIFNKDPSYFWDHDNHFSVEYTGSVSNMVNTIISYITKVNEDASYAEILYNELKGLNGEPYVINVKDKKIAFKKTKSGMIHVMQKNAKSYETTGFVDSSKKLEKIIRDSIVKVNNG